MAGQAGDDMMAIHVETMVASPGGTGWRWRSGPLRTWYGATIHLPKLPLVLDAIDKSARGIVQMSAIYIHYFKTICFWLQKKKFTEPERSTEVLLAKKRTLNCNNTPEHC